MLNDLSESMPNLPDTQKSLSSLSVDWPIFLHGSDAVALWSYLHTEFFFFFPKIMACTCRRWLIPYKINFSPQTRINIKQVLVSYWCNKKLKYRQTHVFVVACWAVSQCQNRSGLTPFACICFSLENNFSFYTLSSLALMIFRYVFLGEGYSYFKIMYPIDFLLSSFLCFFLFCP